MLATLYNKATGNLVASVKITEPQELLAHLASGQVGAILGSYDLTLLQLDLQSMTMKLTEAGQAANFTVPPDQLVFLGAQSAAVV
jgi:hypothetical protein